MMESNVRVRGKFFIVSDPVHHTSYTLANKLSAEQLSDSLNELYQQINSQSDVIKGYQDRNDLLFKEYQQLKYIVKESYNSERTMLGKSVLKQLADQIGVEVI